MLNPSNTCKCFLLCNRKKKTLLIIIMQLLTWLITNSIDENCWHRHVFFSITNTLLNFVLCLNSIFCSFHDVKVAIYIETKNFFSFSLSLKLWYYTLCVWGKKSKVSFSLFYLIIVFYWYFAAVELINNKNSNSNNCYLFENYFKIVFFLSFSLLH